MSDNEARARELWHFVYVKSKAIDAVAAITDALAAAELRGKREGLREAQALSPIDDDSSMFTVHEERKRLHNAIARRLAALGDEPEGT